MKNKEALYLLFTANAISGIAQGISLLAIPWYFTSMLDEPGFFGKIYAGATLLSIPWNLYAGTLVDKYSRKNIFIWINIVSALILFGASLYGFAYEGLPVGLIAFVFTAIILNFNIHYPALYAFGQEISDPKDYGRISSIFEVLHQSTTILSGGVAAILLTGIDSAGINMLGLQLRLPIEIDSWELYEIFLLDAATYVVALILISLMKFQPVAVRKKDTSRIMDRIKTGFRFLMKNPLIFLFGVMSYNIFVIILIEVHLLLPIYVDNHLELGADVLASSEIYYAFGALVAGLSIRLLFSKSNTIFAVLVLMFVNGAVFITAGLTRDFLLFYFISIIMGLTNAGTRVMRVTYLFKLISNEIIGRCGSVFAVINIILRVILISLFSISFFMSGNNVIYAYIFCGAFVIVSMIPLIIKYKKLKALETNAELGAGYRID